MEAWEYETDTKTEAVRKDDTLTRRIGDRLKGILATVNDAHAELVMLHERTFGPTPPGQAPGDGNKDQPQSAGRAGDILAMLERLQTQAARVASQARSLNVRI